MSVRKVGDKTLTIVSEKRWRQNSDNCQTRICFLKLCRVSGATLTLSRETEKVLSSLVETKQDKTLTIVTEKSWSQNSDNCQWEKLETKL